MISRNSGVRAASLVVFVHIQSVRVYRLPKPNWNRYTYDSVKRVCCNIRVHTAQRMKFQVWRKFLIQIRVVSLTIFCFFIIDNIFWKGAISSHPNTAIYPTWDLVLIAVQLPWTLQTPFNMFIGKYIRLSVSTEIDILYVIY